MKTRPVPVFVNRLKDLRLALDLHQLEPEDLLKDVKLAQLLLQIDEQLAQECLAHGCQNPQCQRGTKLHRGDYPRNTSNCAPEVKPYYERKFSSNCSVCDARVTPPSVRFLGGVWRISIALALTTACGVHSVSWLAKHLGVPERTVKRWRRWWHTRFVANNFWDIHRADFSPPVEHAQLPGGAMVRFVAANVMDKLIAFLQFLSPLRMR
jgi:hypothetical protein